MCTHNSARPQKAEGLLRDPGKGQFKVFSAGTEATHVRPLAIKAKAQKGIAMSGQRFKVLTEYLGAPFDYVITVCDQGSESCPVFPGVKNRLRWSFPDPSKATGTEADQLAVYSQVRDAIASRIKQELL